jgi:hypothetical protein
MAKSVVRFCAIAWLVALEAFGAPPGPAPAEGELRGGMDCRAERETGRLVCSVELEAPADEVLTWSDALVVSAPPAARPLRARVAGTGRPPRRIVLGFVLGPGAGGRIEVLARAVTCPTSETRACASRSRRFGYDVEGR